MIKYPNNIVKKSLSQPKISHANRGMNFEEKLKITHEFYKSRDIALIYKKQTPIKVLKSEKNLITKAFFMQRSTTDYSGVYRGLTIDFEAKSTKLNSFNFKTNLHAHQIDHLALASKHGAITFLLLEFKTEQTVFLITYQLLTSLLESRTKSISFNYCLEHCFTVTQSNIIDYLAVISKIYLGENHEKKEKI